MNHARKTEAVPPYRSLDEVLNVCHCCAVAIAVARVGIAISCGTTQAEILLTYARLAFGDTTNCCRQGNLRRTANIHNKHGFTSHCFLPPRFFASQAGEANSREDFAGGKGTGGTPLLDFLKPLKEDARAAFLEKHGTASTAHT